MIGLGYASGMRLPRTISRLVALVSVAFALTLSSTALTSTARADHDIRSPYTGNRGFQLDFHGGFTWYGTGVAAGARFGIPLVHNGFVPTLDNAVYLNFGLDLYYMNDTFDCTSCIDNYGFGFGVPVALHWEFFFNDTWSAFAEIGAQFVAHPYWFRHGQFRSDPGQWFLAAVGGSLHFSEAFSLTLRVGNPYVALGVVISF